MAVFNRCSRVLKSLEATTTELHGAPSTALTYGLMVDLAHHCLLLFAKAKHILLWNGRNSYAYHSTCVKLQMPPKAV